jgi:APA family basic amino acid/polyamine antiporter
MAREGDLPRALTGIWSRFGVPWAADTATAVVVIVLLLTTDVLTVVGFSSFGVLLYYAVANAAAFTLTERQWYAPKFLNVAGAAGCLVLAFTLPGASVLTMTAILAVGVAGRAVVLQRRGRRSTRS